MLAAVRIIVEKRGVLVGDYLYPFAAIKHAIICLLMAVCMLIECKYGVEESILCSVVMIGCWYFWRCEDRDHSAVQREIDIRERRGIG